MEYNEKYRRENKEYFKTKRSEWRKKQKQNQLYLFKESIRRSITKSINRKFTKTSRTKDILGCDYDTLIKYFESKFESWMNWDNHGKYNGEFCYGWDIDHIVPISSAKDKEDVIRLNHHTNLQPLCSKMNRDVKKNKIY